MPQGTLLLQLDMNLETFLVENKEAGLPKISIVRPLSSFEIVDLRPGEATMISYDLQLKKDVFQKTKKIIFEYSSTSKKDRYPFWNGMVISKEYPLHGTKSFHIIGPDGNTKPDIKIDLSIAP